MNRHLKIVAIVSVLSIVIACGPQTEEPIAVEDPVQVAQPQEQLYRHEPSGPMGYHFEGLPDGWSVESEEGGRTMLASDRQIDAWIVAYVEDSILGDDLEKGVQRHQLDAQRAEGGRHLDSGSIETTLGPSVWSLARFDEDEEIVDELVIFAPHPSEYAAVSLRYVYPASDNTDPAQRLIELVEVLETMKSGV